VVGREDSISVLILQKSRNGIKSLSIRNQKIYEPYERVKIRMILLFLNKKINGKSEHGIPNIYEA